jgi:peptidylprolyl isomerase
VAVRGPPNLSGDKAQVPGRKSPTVGKRWLPCAILLLAGCLSAPTPHPPLIEHEAIQFGTDAGQITVLLYPEAAPKTVALMKTYVEEGYYVGRSFGRIVPGHVIQVTDASGGASDDTRRVPVEHSPGYHFAAGAVGIARGDDPDSGGPEFFIMDFATSHLDGNYTVWGQVVDGLDVVHKIARGPAFDFSQLPPALAPAETTDRLAVPPVTIHSAALVHVEVVGSSNPLQVAKDVRAGEFRHSLEWPNDLAAGRPSPLTWYMRSYDGTDPPASGSLDVEIGTQHILVDGEATPGIYHFTWTPPDLLHHTATLHAGTTTLATLDIDPAKARATPA